MSVGRCFQRLQISKRILAVLLRLLQKLISEFVPLVTKRATATACVKPRLPKHVRKLILIKRKAWRRWKASSSSTDKDAYNRASRACRLGVRRHLAAPENDLLTAGPRRFYSYVSRQLNHDGNGCCILTRSGLLSTHVTSVLPSAKNFLRISLRMLSHPRASFAPTATNLTYQPSTLISLVCGLL